MDRIEKKIVAYRKMGKPHTWSTVLEFIQEMGFDQDEYFHVYPSHKHKLDLPIWNGQHWIAVFWVVGGNEGYYVHVENCWNDQQGDHADLILLGKFWGWDRAEAATRAIQRFVNRY